MKRGGVRWESTQKYSKYLGTRGMVVGVQQPGVVYTDCSYLLYILLLFFITNNLLKDHKTICTKRAVKEIYSFIYKWLIISIEGNYEVSRSCPA